MWLERAASERGGSAVIAAGDRPKDLCGAAGKSLRITALVCDSGAERRNLMGAIPPVLLLDQVRDRIRVKHYSIRTEQAYCDWIKRFVIFHGKRHPSAMGAAEVEMFLTSLAVQRRGAASTQNQAKSALLFLYKEVLGAELPWLDSIQKAKTPVRLPVVLTRDEVARVLARLDGVHRLIGALLYGTGLRIMEAMRLRVKDVEFSRREILVRDGKGSKDRVTMLPLRLVGPLREQMEHARELHRGDVAEGLGAVWLPFALDRKYPGAAREWSWQYVFPADARSIDARDRTERRHHLSDPVFQRAMKYAVRGADIAKPATPHALRHSYCGQEARSARMIRSATRMRKAMPPAACITSGGSIAVAGGRVDTPHGPRLTPRYFHPMVTILRRMNAICVASGSSFGQTSWQASSDMQPKTPVSSPINS